MHKPILGKQTFLKENTKRLVSFEKYINEIYDRKVDEKPLYTGRYFVILKEGVNSYSKTQKLFESNLGLRVANTKDFKSESFDETKIQDADALIYDDLGIALVSGQEEQIKILESAHADYIIEPEKIVYVPDEAPATLNIPATWGITATQVMNSQFTGLNVKVAVLDTGFDINHPDFTGRNITTSSFVPNETIDDMHGHGTHCIGTACGNTDMSGQRYGVAKDALIYAGKVLSNEGSGAQAWILNGMTWAANSGCKVISMSLGSRVFPGQGYDIAYERAAQYALSKGAVVVAAAGNESRRSTNQFNPVGSPGDCPSILAVAALDSNLSVADFSNRAINPTGQIDIAGPGVMIYSSWPAPMRYRTISGTSMATPHIAGIIALLWEKFPTYTPAQITYELKKLAKILPLPISDIGAGLSIAP
jgi:subtilisin family serine protease